MKSSPKSKLGKVVVGSNIAQNHSSESVWRHDENIVIRLVSHQGIIGICDDSPGARAMSKFYF